MIKTIWITLMILSLTNGLRILVFFPMFSKSHSILGNGIVTRLLEAGHEVVHVTSYPRETPTPKLHEINVSEGAAVLAKQRRESDAFKLKNLIGANLGDSPFMVYFAYETHRQVLEDGPMQEFLSDPKEHFDAVIAEWFFTELHAGIAPLFNCPLIWLASTEAHWNTLMLIDELPNPAYTVDVFSSYRAPLTFWQRLHETWTLCKRYVIRAIFVQFMETPGYNRIYSPIAEKRGVNLPSHSEAAYNASLMLINSHPSMGTPFRLPQNAKYIGGYHVDTKPKLLPKELQKLMDGAKHGIIYFSMGSNLKSSDLSEEMRDSFLKLYGELKQTVIWKFEEDLPNVPGNIHLVKWAPQQSILAHPNLKMFITHGGQLSTTEALHYGVPLIGMPVMGDQHINMRSVEEKGFGIAVDLASGDVNGDLRRAINDILHDESYKTKAKELSAIYHDRLSPPGKELVHWVEHVVKTRGALHLRSLALIIPWYQKLHFDVAAFLLVVISRFWFIWIGGKKVVRYVKSKYRSYKNESQKDKTS